MIRYVVEGVRYADQGQHVGRLVREAMLSPQPSVLVLDQGLTLRELGVREPKAAFLSRARAKVARR